MNMSYCRFQNTARDLQDCADHFRSLNPKDKFSNNRDELRARSEIVRLAAQILCECGIADPEDEHEIDAAIYDLEQSEPVED